MTVGVLGCSIASSPVVRGHHRSALRTRSRARGRARRRRRRGDGRRVVGPVRVRAAVRVLVLGGLEDREVLQPRRRPLALALDTLALDTLALDTLALDLVLHSGRRPLDLDVAVPVQAAPADAEAGVLLARPEVLLLVEGQHGALERPHRREGEHEGEHEGDGQGEEEASHVGQEEGDPQAQRPGREVAVELLGPDLVAGHQDADAVPLQEGDGHEDEDEGGRVPGLGGGAAAHEEGPGQGLDQRQCDDQAEQAEQRLGPLGPLSHGQGTHLDGGV